MDRGYKTKDDSYRSRDDFPKYSRLFVIGGKNANEADIKDRFSEFGEIEYVNVKKDRDTNQLKGFSYVKYTKTSDAAEALEGMNGKLLGNDSRPIKVVIASNSKVPGGGPDQDITATRLFIMCPKTSTVDELEEVFCQWGDVEHVSLVHDRETSAPKGLAFINYHKFSCAARALEECDDSYKAKFAEPKARFGESKRGREEGGYGGDARGGYGGDMGGRGGYGGDPMGAMMNLMGGNNSGCCSLRVLFDPSVSKDMFWALFNIVPGLVSCDFVEMLRDGMAISSVVYSNPASAGHAVERINGFEYPTGSRLQVRLDDGGAGYGSGATLGRPNDRGLPDKIQNLVSTIAQATDAIKSSGFGEVLGSVGFNGGSRGGGMGGGSMGRGMGRGSMGGPVLGAGVNDAQKVCSAKLPAKEQLVPGNTKCEERLFFVLKDARDCPDPDIITDLFCRFGQLIEAGCIRGKKCGYARYGRKENAARALAMLDGEDLLGSRFKVEVAEDQTSRTKRPRYDD